ncbi:MAG: DNA polymerase-3 subunit beta [Candidatus Poriferisodalaceae bacterium]
MKFRCERDLLVDRLSNSSRAVSSRGGALPVLTGMRLVADNDHLMITGSDLDLTIRSTLTVSVEEPGVAVLPARLTVDIVRSLDQGAVEIEVTGDEAKISGGRSQFSVRTLPADDFPQLAEPGGDEVTVPAADLSAGLRQVVMAASSDDARPILTGVLLSAEEGGLRLVATDSYRLAVRDLPEATVLSEGQKVLVPSRALGELVRILGDTEVVTVRLGEREVTFDVTDEYGTTQVTTRLIEGEFPNYRQLIPSSYPNRVIVGREPLLEAVRRVKLMAREAAPLRMTLRSDSIELMAVTQDVGQAHEVVDAKFDGDELTVAFNPDYLIAGIEAAPGDEVQLETLDALKPAVLRSTENDGFLYLLMPVRVS